MVGYAKGCRMLGNHQPRLVPHGQHTDKEEEWQTWPLPDFILGGDNGNTATRSHVREKEGGKSAGVAINCPAHQRISSGVNSIPRLKPPARTWSHMLSAAAQARNGLSRCELHISRRNACARGVYASEQAPQRPSQVEHTNPMKGIPSSTLGSAG